MGDPSVEDPQHQSPLALLMRAAAAVPLWQYALLACFVFALFLYRALELHFLEDLLSGFRGHPVQVLYNPASQIAKVVLPKCEILKTRFWPAPWLCSPHLQTGYLHYFGQPPQVVYYRQLCRTPEGGTIALDWLDADDCQQNEEMVRQIKDVASYETTPAVVLIPGLTSDSANTYVKHIVHSLSQRRWRVVVANHRGLGGVSVTSNQFYNAGWTEDLRRIVNHLHRAYPNAPILAVGTSIGANILVKYLGEEGEHTPLAGAAAICCPWDLLVCDRFISRRFIQRLYDKVLAFGLRSYAQLHQATLSQIADWDPISKSQSIRDFDNFCTRVVGNYETVDTYYRKCSSAYYLESVTIPLFCISALDDPVCTKEAIPWDECRINENVVLGITKHGGHLAFFEGVTASSIWWVRATTEFLEILSESSLLHKQNQVQAFSAGLSPVLENTIDKSPYVKFSQNGVIAQEEAGSGEENGDIHQELSALPNAQGLQLGQRAFTTFATTDVNNSETPIAPMDTNGTKPPNLWSFKSKQALDTKPSSSTGLDMVVETCHPTPNIGVNGQWEPATLESTVLQLAEQVEALRHLLQREKEVPVFGMVMQQDSRESGYGEWASCGSRSLELVDTNEKSLELTDTNGNGERTAHGREVKAGGLSKGGNSPSVGNVDGLSNSSCAGANVKTKPLIKNISALKARNRHTLKLLAYVAIVTTWPIVGSALFLYGRKSLKNIASKYWRK